MFTVRISQREALFGHQTHTHTDRLIDDELTGLSVPSLISDVFWQPAAIAAQSHSSQLQQRTNMGRKIIFSDQ